MPRTTPLNERLPYVVSLPGAVGTGIIISLSSPAAERLRDRLLATDKSFERAFSRFRPDSLVTLASQSVHKTDEKSQQESAADGGGNDDHIMDDRGRDVATPHDPRPGDSTSAGAMTRRIEFPAYANALFSICDAMHERTDGAFDPCVGESLVKLGYGHAFAATGSETSASPRWGADVTHDGSTLVLRRPAFLDFGAVGKGFLVDLLAQDIRRAIPGADFVIDAGGDMFSTLELTIALEDPHDATRAVGVAHIPSGAFCASSPSRRHWTEADGLTQAHHLLDAITGEPVRDVAASWTYVPMDEDEYPTAWADAQSTAAFVGLRSGFPFARLRADGSAEASARFPGRFFIRSTDGR